MKKSILSFFFVVFLFLVSCGSYWIVKNNPHWSRYFTNLSNVSLQPEVVVEVPPPFVPHQLEIPNLDVSAQVEHVGLDEQRRMDVPKNYQNVAWYQYGPQPGHEGSAVIAGHFDAPTGPAIFYELDQVKPGDEVVVKDAQGQSKVFVVEAMQVFKDKDFPIAEVFEKKDGKRLNLITCSGRYDQAQKNYSDRLVVFTRLKEDLSQTVSSQSES